MQLKLAILLYPAILQKLNARMKWLYILYWNFYFCLRFSFDFNQKARKCEHQRLTLILLVILLKHDTMNSLRFSKFSNTVFEPYNWYPIRYLRNKIINQLGFHSSLRYLRYSGVFYAITSPKVRSTKYCYSPIILNTCICIIFSCIPYILFTLMFK